MEPPRQLLAHSCHAGRRQPCPLSGVKRTSKVYDVASTWDLSEVLGLIGCKHRLVGGVLQGRGSSRKIFFEIA